MIQLTIDQILLLQNASIFILGMTVYTISITQPKNLPEYAIVITMGCFLCSAAGTIITTFLRLMAP